MITKTEVSLGRGRKNAWFLAWFHLVPHWSKLQKSYFLQGISLVPGLVPLGSYLVPVCVIHKNRGFAWDGSEKCLVPGLVPLGSALVQVTKKLFFTGNQLGSWLGSTWFLLGSSLRDPQKQRFRLGWVEKVLGSWLGSTWFLLRKSKASDQAHVLCKCCK